MDFHILTFINFIFNLGNEQEVFKLIKKNIGDTRLHSFGVGNDCSKDQVIEMAKSGRGTYSFVDQQSDDLKGKVITALKRAVELALKNCRFITCADVELMTP